MYFAFGIWKLRWGIGTDFHLSVYRGDAFLIFRLPPIKFAFAIQSFDQYEHCFQPIVFFLLWHTEKRRWAIFDLRAWQHSDRRFTFFDLFNRQCYQTKRWAA